MSWTSVSRRTRRARATRPAPRRGTAPRRGQHRQARRGAEGGGVRGHEARTVGACPGSSSGGRPHKGARHPVWRGRHAWAHAVPPPGQRSGTLPVTRVPSPGTASTASSPATAARRSSGSSSQACTGTGRWRPRVVVAHLEAQALVRPERDRDPGRLAADVGQRSDAGEVDGALDLLGVAPDAVRPRPCSSVACSARPRAAPRPARGR